MSVAPESENRASSQWKVRKGWFQGHGADKANTVIGTPPGSFDWPVPISQLRSVGRALCTAAHFAPVIALDREVMPQPPELPSANDQALEQPTLWYRLHSRAPGGIRLHAAGHRLQ